MVNIIHEILVNVSANVMGFKAGFKTVRAGIVRNTKQLNEFTDASFRAGGSIALLSERFQSWALSMMFTGMQLVRIFQSISRASVDSFTRIMESSGFAGSAIQQLAVYMEYLKFTIGSAINTALMPLLPMIIQIVSSIANWISQHPKLATALLALIGILGTVLSLGAMIVLNMNWLIPLFVGLGSAATVVTASTALLVIAFMAVFAAIALLVIKLGGFGEFFKALFRGILRFFVIIIDVLVSLFRDGMNTLISVMEFAGNKIIDGLNWLVEQANKLLESSFIQSVAKQVGLTINPIAQIGALSMGRVGGDFGDIFDAYAEWEAGSSIAQGGQSKSGQSQVYIENQYVQTTNYEQMLNGAQSYQR